MVAIRPRWRCDGTHRRDARRSEHTDPADDAIVTAVDGRIAGKFPTLDVAQLTGHTRNARAVLAPLGSGHSCPFWWSGASWLP